MIKSSLQATEFGSNFQRQQQHEFKCAAIVQEGGTGWRETTEMPTLQENLLLQQTVPNCRLKIHKRERVTSQGLRCVVPHSHIECYHVRFKSNYFDIAKEVYKKTQEYTVPKKELVEIFMEMLQRYGMNSRSGWRLLSLRGRPSQTP
jgi:hypothetical protein